MRQDLKKIDMSWEEAIERCVDREDWCVAQCVFDTNWTSDRETQASAARERETSSRAVFLLHARMHNA